MKSFYKSTVYKELNHTLVLPRPNIFGLTPIVVMVVFVLFPSFPSSYLNGKQQIKFTSDNNYFVNTENTFPEPEFYYPVQSQTFVELVNYIKQNIINIFKKIIPIL